MKYIFWDFNGTILDDARLCYDILTEMLKEENRPPVTFEEYLMIFTFPVEAYYDIVYDLKKTSFKELAHRFIDRYQPRSLACPLHDGVIETIKACENLGYINVLLSASEEKNLHEQLKHYHIEHLFQSILGTTNVYATSKIAVGKRFMDENNIDPKDVIMIGDTLHDAEVAESLGIRIILFTKGHQHPSRLKKYETIDQIQALLGKI
ncbi:MAG: HAD hydrolase-like protein [Acholeplasmataceae bacterium]|jgi:phosphoglycolate phosphatase|nr:HAD hydrolase-like protein [Acholeplasmataceae bacterium]